MATRAPKPALPSMATYTPPEPAFTVCGCGALIQTRVFVFGTKDTPAHWRALPEAITPGDGVAHVCAHLAGADASVQRNLPAGPWPTHADPEAA